MARVPIDPAAAVHPATTSARPAATAVRPATAADVRGIAEVHVAAWRSAYAGIVPDATLDALDVEARAARLARRFGPDAVAGTVPTLVAVAAGRVLGFVNAGPYRDDDVPPDGPGWGEIYAIYVHPACTGRGLGRQLITAALATLAPDRPVALWVFAANTGAQGFYARMGFAPDGGQNVFEIGGAAIREVRFLRPRAGGPEPAGARH